MGVKHFVFAPICSSYGKMANSNDCIDEEGDLNPVSLYAKLKVQFEKYLLGSELQGMAAAALRFSTAYGPSPRMRFDLTVNEFVKEVVLGRELVVFGEQFWRPYCHTEDLANACLRVLEADKNVVDRCEDFYRNKHLNSDLLSVNFTDMSDEEFHRSLMEANLALIDNNQKKKYAQMTEITKNLYLNKDVNFRGYRQT